MGVKIKAGLLIWAVKVRRLPHPQDGPKKWPKGLDLFAPPPEVADRPVDLFAPPPKMSPRSGRKAWNCLPHPPKRAPEVAERPGLVCPAPRSGRKAWTCLPSPQKRPKKWPKGLQPFRPLLGPIWGVGQTSPPHSRVVWTCLPRPRSGRKACGLVCPTPQDEPKKSEGLNGKERQRRGVVGRRHKQMEWARSEKGGLFLFFPVRSHICLLCEKVLWPESGFLGGAISKWNGQGATKEPIGCCFEAKNPAFRMKNPASSQHPLCALNSPTMRKSKNRPALV